MDAAPLLDHDLEQQGGRLRRVQKHAKKVGEAERRSFCAEHYGRLPGRKNSPSKWSNLWGVLNTPVAQAVEIFVLLRNLTVYDVFSDVRVTGHVDKARDPWWFWISVFLIILPIVVKAAIFAPLGTRKITAFLLPSAPGRSRHPEDHFCPRGVHGRIAQVGAFILYAIFGTVALAVVDVYLLLFYPWVSPTDSLLGTVERLSPIVETFLEGIMQSSWQVYMWIRCLFLPDRIADDKLERLLLMSFLPSLLSIAKKLHDLRSDSREVGMGFVQYVLELFKGPLGLSAPFLTLLTKREAVHYDTFGPLTQTQQKDIFRALGKDNKKLLEVTFDAENSVDLVSLCESVVGNDTLELVAVGGDHSAETIVDAFVALNLGDHGLEVAALLDSPECLATACTDGSARVYEVSTGQELCRVKHGYQHTNVACSPDGVLLTTTAFKDKTARVWEVPEGRQLCSLKHEDVVNGVAWSPDGLRLATASADKTARVWEVSTGQELCSVKHEKWSVNGVAWSPDGLRLATACDDGSARVWEVPEGRQLCSVKHEAVVYGVAWSPDGLRLATASLDNTARVWEVPAGQELCSLWHEKNSVNGVAWSPDGLWLATASGNTARVWEVPADRQLCSLWHEKNSVTGVAWSPDGLRLATSSADKTARVWEVPAGRQLCSVKHEGQVQGVAWSPMAWRARQLFLRVRREPSGEEVVYPPVPPGWPLPAGLVEQTEGEEGSRPNIDQDEDKSKGEEHGAERVPVPRQLELAVRGQVFSVDDRAELLEGLHSGSSPDALRLARALMKKDGFKGEVAQRIRGGDLDPADFMKNNMQATSEYGFDPATPMDSTDAASWDGPWGLLHIAYLVDLIGNQLLKSAGARPTGGNGDWLAGLVHKYLSE